MTNLFRKAWLIGLWWNKTKAKWHLENDIEFLKAENNTIFEKTEEELREDLEKLNKIDVDLTEAQVNEKAEIERTLNKYKSIKAVYGQTGDEHILITKYIDFIKKSILK